LLTIPWSCPSHSLGHLGSVTLEIGVEQGSKTAGSGIVFGGVRPGVARTKQFGRHVGTLLWNVQSENRIDGETRASQRAIKDGAYHRAGMGQTHAPAFAEAAARPTGVDEPDLGAVAAQAVPKHLRVSGGRQGQERGGEAGAERGLGIGYASLGAGDLRRVAR